MWRLHVYSGHAGALHAFHHGYPILDFQALATLSETRRRTQYSPDLWPSYATRCRDLARAAGVSVRDLDKALRQDSVENSYRS